MFMHNYNPVKKSKMQYSDDKYYFKNVAMSTLLKRRFRNSHSGMTRIAEPLQEIDILKVCHLHILCSINRLLIIVIVFAWSTSSAVTVPNSPFFR